MEAAKQKICQVLADIGLDPADFDEEDILILWQNKYRSVGALKVATRDFLERIQLSAAAVDLVLSVSHIVTKTQQQLHRRREWVLDEGEQRPLQPPPKQPRLLAGPECRHSARGAAAGAASAAALGAPPTQCADRPTGQSLAPSLPFPFSALPSSAVAESAAATAAAGPGVQSEAFPVAVQAAEAATVPPPPPLGRSLHGGSGPRLPPRTVRRRVTSRPASALPAAVFVPAFAAALSAEDRTPAARGGGGAGRGSVHEDPTAQVLVLTAFLNERDVRWKQRLLQFLGTPKSSSSSRGGLRGMSVFAVAAGNGGGGGGVGGGGVAARADAPPPPPPTTTTMTALRPVSPSTGG